MSKIELRVKGLSHNLDIEPSTPLLYVLRTISDCRAQSLDVDLDSAARAL
jgi:hypothetical protein